MDRQVLVVSFGTKFSANAQPLVTQKKTLQNGQTPLHVAALCGLPEIARILLAKGAQVDKDDEVSESASPHTWSWFSHCEPVERRFSALLFN